MSTVATEEYRRRSSRFGHRWWAAWLVIGTLIASASAAQTALPQSRAAEVQTVSPAAAAAAQTPAAQGQTVNPAVIPAAPQLYLPAIEATVPAAGRCAPLPALAGQNVDEVLPKLSSRLFQPSVTAEPSSQPARTILREPATTLIEGRFCAIAFVVSDGSLTYVPNLYRATREEAAQQLSAAGLEMKPVETPADQPEGSVVEQDPRPKTEVRRGSAVTVWFAMPTLYELPNVIGQEIRAARRALRPFEMRVEPVAGLQPRGEITGQTPAGPSQQPRGAEVALEVSDGSLVRVPPLIGSTREEATERLTGTELQVAVVEAPSEEPAGRVFKQRPAPEQVVTRQSVVEVVIAVPTLYEVPNVIGLQLPDAVRRLRSFTIGRNEVPSPRPRGEVTDQEPRVPAQLPERAEVRVDVSDGSLVRVPGVEQQPLDEARAELGRADLQAAVAEREGDLAPGVVATQDPPAGKEVKRGSAVRLAVSTGIEVPKVVGVQVDEARTLLSRFEVSEAEVANRAIKGEIVTQRPDPGTRVAARSPVAIEISDGSRVVVPELKEKTLTQARAELEQVGLEASPEPKAGALESDKVVSQDPAAGAEASRGDTVRVVVSTGVEMPDVTGKRVEEATQVLSGFTVRTQDVQGNEPKGQVIKQEPAAGTRVAADAPVGLEVSDGSQAVVPDVEGKALEAARTEVEGVGLVIDATPQSDSRPTGTVLRQEPKAGVIASRGDTVRVDVATGNQIPLWVWLLGGLAVLGAGVPLVRWIRKMIRPPMSYRVRFETEPDSVRITEVAAVGPDVRIAARLETGESVVRFDGDPT